jgi:hypothetical protein
MGRQADSLYRQGDRLLRFEMNHRVSLSGMGIMKKFGFLTAAIAAALMCSTALAADVGGRSTLPAVSAPNGKVELSAGWADIDVFNDSELLRGGLSFSFPVGDTLGIQADLAAVDAFGDTLLGGNLHIFTRDPSRYLLGVTGGAGFGDNASLYYIGPEAELYLGNLSIEAWVGYLNVDLDGASSSDEFFGFGDLAFYPADNLRLTLGASSVANFETAHAGLEWMMSDTGLPLSFTADARIGEDDFLALRAGANFYFGGEDKSLIRRHREDDPRNRSLDIFSAAGGSTLGEFGNCPRGESDIDPTPVTDCRF